MHTRIISGIIAGIIVILAIAFANPLFINIAITIIAGIGIHEFYTAMKNLDYKPISWIGYSSVVLLLLLGYIDGKKIFIFSMLLLAILIISMLIYAFSEEKSFIDVCITLFGAIYVTFLIAFFLLVYHYQYNGAPIGRNFVWLIIFGGTLTDTFAFLVGVTLGKHKLCPKISPKKTIEGAIGGTLGGMLSFLAFAFVMNNYWNFSLNYAIIAVFGIIVSIFAQLGDLVASYIKRYAKIKDFGNVLPGHGGVLDRIDSILFTAPVVYYFLVLFF